MNHRTLNCTKVGVNVLLHWYSMQYLKKWNYLGCSKFVSSKIVQKKRMSQCFQIHIQKYVILNFKWLTGFIKKQSPRRVCANIGDSFQKWMIATVICSAMTNMILLIISSDTFGKLSLWWFGEWGRSFIYNVSWINNKIINKKSIGAFLRCEII